MARLLEHQAKAILQAKGLPAPRHAVARTAEEAESLAREIGGPVVIKALVPVGRRGKAGAVLHADTPGAALTCSAKLLGSDVAGYPVTTVLVEEKLSIAREMYISLTIDHNHRSPVVMASTLGGVEVEEIRLRHPGKMVTRQINPLEGLAAWEARQVWYDAGLRGKELVQAAIYLVKLYRIFSDYDAYLLEINPFVLTLTGQLVSAAAVMAIDEAAFFRQGELAGQVQRGTERSWRALTELEKKAIQVNEADPYRGTARYTEMPGGDIGFMCGGGGGSLMLFDALVRYGGRPANYSEFGGNPSAEKICGLAKVILSKSGVKGLFVAQNITNNTQVDLVAEGVVSALEETGVDPGRFPVLVREAGVNEEKAREIFRRAGVAYYGDEITMDEAARLIVAKMWEAYPSDFIEGESS